MKIPTKDLLSDLLDVDATTCISLYMPTHRTLPDNEQDHIRFKTLVKNLEQTLLEKHSASESSELLKPFYELSMNEEFWKHTLDGLVVLGSADTFKVIGLPVTTEEVTMVAERFHTQPLRTYLQSLDRYHVLGLSLNDFHIYEGNRHSLTKLELAPGTPKNMEEALGEELTEKHLTVASYGGVKSDSSEMYHGHGGKSPEVDIDAERFFRFVSKTINEQFATPSGLPLILAALPEHHHMFHKVSDIPTLLPDGIDVHSESVEKGELVKRAWKVMEPYYVATIQKVVNEYQEAKGTGTCMDALPDISDAAEAGKVATLLVEADRQEDMDLEAVSEQVSNMGGKVIMIPKEMMPTSTGVACILRY